ncbi:uncharacterized protein LOC113505719 [Trichoplusia ni]|uniref:Uncharacterized protein LOC113505719 n=1 Tax=Trichoplusia ni TaxID=7111 RepID=A0A7E5WU16_TRINI|nr:uncharacterized protein LOC113505719 [Trichoplusia ni]
MVISSSGVEGTQSRPRPPRVQTRPPPRSSPRLSAAPSRHNESPRSGRSPRQPPSASSDSEHDARSDKDAPGQRRSLRYSDVTRQFAARRRGVTSATSDTSGTPRPAARPGRPSRTSCTYKEASDSSDDFAPKKLTRSRKTIQSER